MGRPAGRRWAAGTWACCWTPRFGQCPGGTGSPGTESLLSRRSKLLSACRCRGTVTQAPKHRNCPTMKVKLLPIDTPSRTPAIQAGDQTCPVTRRKEGIEAFSCEGCACSNHPGDENLMMPRRRRRPLRLSCLVPRKAASGTLVGDNGCNITMQPPLSRTVQGRHTAERVGPARVAAAAVTGLGPRGKSGSAR